MDRLSPIRKRGGIYNIGYIPSSERRDSIIQREAGEKDGLQQMVEHGLFQHNLIHFYSWSPLVYIYIIYLAGIIANIIIIIRYFSRNQICWDGCELIFGLNLVSLTTDRWLINYLPIHSNSLFLYLIYSQKMYVTAWYQILAFLTLTSVTLFITTEYSTTRT